MREIMTVEVPFIPPTDPGVSIPKWIQERVKSFGPGQPDINDFELEEVIGSQWIYSEDSKEWIDIGNKAIYRRKESEYDQE